MRKSTRRIPDFQILLVTSDPDLAAAFRAYIESRYHYNSDRGFYAVLTEASGAMAMEACRTAKPLASIVILDTDLPDMDGYELARRLHECTRQIIGFVFLVANDSVPPPDFEKECFVAKPFKLEEVEQRIQEVRHRVCISWRKNPRTRLPADEIRDALELVLGQQDWVLLCLEANGVDVIEDIYGYDAGTKAVRFIADLIEETIDEYGTPNDFIGHIFGSDFVIITQAQKSRDVSQMLRAHFTSGIQQFYSLETRPMPQITLSVTTIRGSDKPWGSIGEIIDKMAELMHLKEKNEALDKKLGLVKIA